jgi:hypothetical protein
VRRLREVGAPEAAAGEADLLAMRTFCGASTTEASYGSAWRGYLRFRELFGYKDPPLMRGAPPRTWRCCGADTSHARSAYNDADDRFRVAYANRGVRDTLKGFKKLHAEKNPEGAKIKVPWSVNLANQTVEILKTKRADLAQLR